MVASDKIAINLKQYTIVTSFAHMAQDPNLVTSPLHQHLPRSQHPSLTSIHYTVGSLTGEERFVAYRIFCFLFYSYP